MMSHIVHKLCNNSIETFHPLPNGQSMIQVSSKYIFTYGLRFTSELDTETLVNVSCMDYTVADCCYP